MQKLIETLSTVSVGQALTGGITVVALVSVFIEITPVKINPVSKFLAWLGRKINSEVIAKVDRDPGLGSSVRNKAIVHRLYDMGIFEIKDAAQLVAELLGISRHTVYLHIRNHKAELAEQQ